MVKSGDGKIRRLDVLSTTKPQRALFDLADAKCIQDMLDDTIALRRGSEQQVTHMRTQQCHEVSCAVNGKVQCRENSSGTEASFLGDVHQPQVKISPCVYRPIDGNTADEDISRIDSGVRKARIRRRLEQREPLKGLPCKYAFVMSADLSRSMREAA